MFGLYFFKISRSVVFFLFFVVVYLDTVFPSFFASVHSRVITILFSFPFAMITNFDQVCKIVNSFEYKAKKVILQVMVFSFSHIRRKAIFRHLS